MPRTPTEYELNFIYLLFKHGFLPLEVQEIFKMAKRLKGLNTRMCNDSNWSDKDDIRRDKLKEKIHNALHNIRHEIQGDPRYSTVIIYRYDKDEIGYRI